jgi:hypothetical protein
MAVGRLLRHRLDPTRFSPELRPFGPPRPQNRKFQPAPQTQGWLFPLQETKPCAEFRRIL